jgi:hypothetical protein
LRNNFVFNNAVPEFKFGKEEKLYWKEFEEATNEFPQLLEPGLAAIGALDLIIDKENIPENVKTITEQLKLHIVPKINYHFANPKNLDQLMTIYYTDLNMKANTQIQYDINKNLAFYGIVEHFTTVKKTDVLPEKLIIDVVCANEYFEENVYFDKILTWTNYNKKLIRQDLIVKTIDGLGDEDKKIACAVLEMTGGKTFQKIVDKFKVNFKKNITYQRTKAETIRERGINKTFEKYGIIAANFDIKQPRDYNKFMQGLYLKNKVLYNRLQIGPNPRADFFALKEIDKTMPIKDIIEVAKIQKSTATKINHDFKILHFKDQTA